MANWIKVAGIGLSAAGAVIGFAADRVSEKQRREEIREEVEREFTRRFNNIEENEDEEL